MKNTKHYKIGLISPCGWGNLGDAAIQDAAIYNIRSLLPNSDIYGFTMNPEDTLLRHNIISYKITELSLSYYMVADSNSTGGIVCDDIISHKSGCKEIIKKIPLLFSVLRSIKNIASESTRLINLLIREISSICRWINQIRAFDYLIVSGGGQLDEFWGGAWGHPYALFRWAVIARLGGAKYIVLSVGTSSLESYFSKLFVRGALTLSHYRSFRDGASRNKVDFIAITRNDKIVPDLAFSLPVKQYIRTITNRSRPVVGISPMSYCDPRTWPAADSNKYERYIKELSCFVIWLINNNYDVKLFASDKSDIVVIDDLLGSIKKTEICTLNNIHGPPELSVDGLMSCLVELDYVVTSRLHGVILSHSVNIPVIALSYDLKVETHMSNFSMTPYCLNIDEFVYSDLIKVFKVMVSNRDHVTIELANKVGQYRQLLNKQYNSVFNEEMTYA